MSSFTAGPWRVEEIPYSDKRNYREGYELSVETDGTHIAAIEDCPKMRANAALIAAAPDLLAALEEIVARNEIQHWFNLDQARAAIAKATTSPASTPSGEGE